jgi:hypothetical protein
VKIVLKSLALAGVLASCTRYGFWRADEELSPCWPACTAVDVPLDCTALPGPRGHDLHVGPVDAAQLASIVAGAAEGTSILLAPGTYPVTETVVLGSAGVSLRGETGWREDVVLDAAYGVANVVLLTAPGALLADVTIRQPGDGNGGDSAVSVVGATEGAVIYGVRVEDPEGIAIHLVGHPSPSDDGILACSEVELTAAGRAHKVGIAAGCDTSLGIYAVGVRGWHIYGNRVTGMFCPPAPSAGIGLFAASRSRDLVIERNVIASASVGMRLGFDAIDPGDVRRYSDDTGAYTDFIGALVRNNVVYDLGIVDPAVDSGIALWSARDVVLVHNTIALDAPGRPPFSGIEWRYASSTELVIANNVLNEMTDPFSEELRLRESAATAVEGGNVIDTPLALFVDAANADFHSSAGSPAIGAADTTVAPGTSDVDFDLRARDATPDSGAFERL